MEKAIEIDKNILIILPSTYNSTERGAFFEKLCANILKKQSYEIKAIEIRKIGMEVDIEAIHTPSQKKIYVECKFYHTQKISANVVDLCFSQAYRNGCKSIALFSTTPLGKDGQGAYQQYLEDEKVDFAYYDRTEILNALIALGLVIDIDALNLNPNIRNATLLIHPEISMIWLFQVIEDGIPQRLLYYGKDERIDSTRIRNILKSKNVFEGLSIEKYNSADEKIITKTQISITKEVVSKILLADDIMDYKPCRPENFVGREQIQKEIWDYLDSVRSDKTDYRILSIVGPSGNGKSSLVANLSERFRNVKWKNKFYLFPVDVRSARGANFIIEAIAKAFDSAINDDFIEYHNEFLIENVSEITSGVSFNKCIDYLKFHNKVLILFFDQFEEIFMKEELFGLFKAFERIAIDTSSERTNFVLGFSWRSGITLGEENPAYSMWNRLKDFRVDKRLDNFYAKDSSKMVSSFEKSTSKKLISSLRKRIIQQSQGLPWFLKKLCIHIFKKIVNGVSQEDLLINQFQIKDLFDDDLDRPDKECDCLKFVANNSPIDQYEVTKEFGYDTLQTLIADRLVIKTGEKISVYWDVFRDYLRTQQTPIIPWTYMPSYNITSSLKLLDFVEKDKAFSLESLTELSDYTNGTINNIITDLQSFSIIKKNQNNNYILAIDKKNIADSIRSHFLGHVVYLKILEESNKFSPKYVTKEYFTSIVNKYFSNSEGNPQIGYSNKLISWFQYAGLISFRNNKVYMFEGDEYSAEYATNKKSNYLFLGGGSAEKALTIINLLKKKKTMDIYEQEDLKARNAVTDLVTLGICYRDNDSCIQFTKSVSIEDKPLKILCSAIIKSETIILLHKYLPDYGNDKLELARKIESEIGKNWKDSSRKRNISSLIKFYLYAKNAGFEVSA